MTTVCKELNESRRVEVVNGVRTGYRVFVLYDSGSGSGTITRDTDEGVIAALYGTATSPDMLPNYNFSFNYGTGTVGNEMLFACDPRVEKYADSADMWRVEWKYTTSMQPPGPGPSDPNYLDWDMDGQSELINIYRKAPFLHFYNTGDPPDLDTQPDIGGRPQDSAGEPVSRAHKTAMFSPNEILVYSTAADVAAHMQFLRAFQNRRNNIPFQGAPPGQILYVKTRTERLGVRKYRFSHLLVADEWMHMRQTAERDQDGKVRLYTLGGKWFARNVYWYQPFPDYGDLNQISGNF